MPAGPRWEIEDLLVVAAALALGELARRSGTDGWLQPWVWGPVLGGVALCVFTLGPDDADEVETELRRAVLGIPAALLLLALLLEPGAFDFWRGLWFFLLLTVAVNLVLAVLRRGRAKLPRMPRTPRRFLVAPAQVAGVALFEAWVRPGFLDSAFVAGKPAAGRLVLLLLASLLLYWSAIIGPRILAGGSRHPATWLPRYLVYLAATAVALRDGGW
jgi:hypothetical protein